MTTPDKWLFVLVAMFALAGWLEALRMYRYALRMQAGWMGALMEIARLYGSLRYGLGEKQESAPLTVEPDDG